MGKSIDERRLSINKSGADLLGAIHKHKTIIFLTFFTLPTMARILPTGLILKTTQNYKPLWVPNPKKPMEFRDKHNPTHTRGFFQVRLGNTHKYPP